MRTSPRSPVGRWRWLGWLTTAALLQAEDAGKPPPVFAACHVCHEPAGNNKLGPNLAGIFGRKAGTVPGFRYSRAMARAKIVWEEKSLDEFLADPQRLVPGNIMPYPGLADERQRKALIEYLKTLDPPEAAR